MNSAFLKILAEDKVDIDYVKKFYDDLHSKTDTPDDEFAEYISSKKEMRD